MHKADVKHHVHTRSFMLSWFAKDDKSSLLGSPL